MSTHTPRERWLRGATIASAFVVALSHSGGPISCATTVQQVETRTLRVPLYAWQQPQLVLTKRSPATAPSVARIERGSLVELRRIPGAPGEPTSVGALAGFDPNLRSILITSDDETIEVVPYEQLQTITVLGESPTAGHVGNGALIGGLSGLAIGGLVGGVVGASPGLGSSSGAVGRSVFCAAIVGIPTGLVGAGIGAPIGAATSPGRARAEFPLGPAGWHIETMPAMQPGPRQVRDAGKATP